jgi:hypothetical protein
MLVAVVALRIDSGTFSIPDMVSMAKAGHLTGSHLPYAGMLVGMKFTTWVFWFLFIAFAIKVPVFPFHTWPPTRTCRRRRDLGDPGRHPVELGATGCSRLLPIVPDAYRQRSPRPRRPRRDQHRVRLYVALGQMTSSA